MIKNLNCITHIVKEILENDVKARNSDSFLYLKVIQTVATSKGIDVSKMSVETYLLRMNELKLPKFETVRRARQKLQAEYPEFSADINIERERMINERIYRKYATDKGFKL